MKLLDKLNIRYPIIQAPMAGAASTPELIAAVSNAGGLGSLGAGYMSPDDIRAFIRAIRALTKNPFAVNLFIPENHDVTKDEMEVMCHVLEECCKELNIKITPVKPPYLPSFAEQMQIILDEKVPVFSFTFGIPESIWIAKCKNQNITLVGTATNLNEALSLEANEIDVVVAQGSEAGGHRGTFIGRAEDSLIKIATLIPLLKDVKIPKVAAGGIMNAEDLEKIIELGADGVQMGTAFLSCHESGIPSNYKNILLNTREDNTVLTRAFSGKMARGVNNKFIALMAAYQDKILDYPIQNALTTPMRKAAEKQMNTDFISMWAGQSAHLCQDCSVAELMKQLTDNIIF